MLVKTTKIIESNHETISTIPLKLHRYIYSFFQNSDTTTSSLGCLFQWSALFLEEIFLNVQPEPLPQHNLRPSPLILAYLYSSMQVTLKYLLIQKYLSLFSQGFSPSYWSPYLKSHWQNKGSSTMLQFALCRLPAQEEPENKHHHRCAQFNKASRKSNTSTRRNME